MRYKGKVYRPPSEAYSLIIQVTYGCSHNRCAFCDMYDDKRFALRPMEEIREDFRLARQVYRRVERVFLADGDALMRKTDELLEILAMVYSLFPECQRVTCYASPRSLQVKTDDELRQLRENGLKMGIWAWNLAVTRCWSGCARATPPRPLWRRGRRPGRRAWPCR